MTVSRLVRSREQMWSDLLVALGGSESYKTMSEEELLAAIRNTYGGSVSALTTSQADLLASIVSAAGGSTSVLTQSEERMLVALATALGGSGSVLTSSSDALLAASVDAAQAGGGAYVAKAVHFDGATSIKTMSLLAGADSPYLSAAFFFKPDVNVGTGYNGIFANAWDVSSYSCLFIPSQIETQIDEGRATPGGIPLSTAYVGNVVSSVVLFGVADVSSDFETIISVDGEIQQTGSTDYSGQVLLVTVAHPNFFIDMVDATDTNTLARVTPASTPVINDHQWHSVVVSGQSNLGAGSKIFRLYIDGVEVGFGDDINPSFVMTNNGVPFVIGDDGFEDFFRGDICDLRIDDKTWLTGGDIATETLRLFITADNKPVDPATATAALGTPLMLFSGDAASFATNQGTGGAFTLTGSLTNASTSPSD